MGSHISNLIHFVWSTRERRAMIKQEWQDQLYAYLGGVLKNKTAKMLAAGGMEDHVHVYASLPSTVTLAEMAGAMKANSSRWIHENVTGAKNFAWQEGYGAFSVSKSVEPSIVRYIRDQAEHHKKREFRAEFKLLLEKHNIDYDERYLWV